VYERVAHDGEPCLGGLAHQLLAVRLPSGVDLGEAAEVPERLSVGVALVIDLGTVALVGAEHDCEGGELRPAHKEFL
jgi:hypothetical protein